MRREILEAFDKKWMEKYGDKNVHEFLYYYVRRMVDEAIHDGMVLHAAQEIPKAVSSLNTPLLALMHDTAHDLDMLRITADNISSVLKETKGTDTRLYVCAEYVKSAYKDLRDKLDEFYVRMKQKEKEAGPVS